MERSFKGIWIPAEVWLSKDLTLQEKVFIVEIDSLDNHHGCFAGNSYFADFFGITKARASQIINSLKDKGYLTVEMERHGKQIIKRTLRINQNKISKQFFSSKNPKEGIKEIKEGVKNTNSDIKNIKQGYLEKFKENNTFNNNTIINPSSKKAVNNINTEWYPAWVSARQAISHNEINMLQGKAFAAAEKLGMDYIQDALKDGNRMELMHQFRDAYNSLKV